ncbi:MAG: hypothetical protein K1Y36_15735 [Blastocatellia bacterium]|nr:hypothetical protein [Blastocatellia bacterium]
MQPKFCVRCGSPLRPGTVLCDHCCWNQLHHAAPAGAPPPVGMGVPAGAPVPAATRPGYYPPPPVPVYPPPPAFPPPPVGYQSQPVPLPPQSPWSQSGFRRPPNGQRTVAAVWLGGAFVGVLMCVLPFVLELDMMRVGFGIVFMGGFVALVGLIGAIMYFSRAKTLDQIFSGQNLLVHWNYTPAEWSNYAEADFAIAKNEKVPLFILTASICLVVGGIFLMADPKAGGFVFLVMVGLVALLGLLVVVVPRLRYAKNRQQVGEAFVSTNGVWLNGQFHSWNLLGGRFEEADLVLGPPLMLNITYSFVTRTGRQYESVRVPVPQHEEAAAHWVAGQLNRMSPG